MAQFFIHRPVFAWVLAIFICIAGIASIPSLPISQYPRVAPPQIQISASYTGATPEEVYNGVAQPIEEELNGIAGIIYFESSSDTSGRTGLNTVRAVAPVTSSDGVRER